MSYLIDPEEPRYRLGVTSMDETHQEFIALINDMADCDKPNFIILFKRLVEHTEAHFTAENRLMKETNFPAIREHMDEHLRVLGELNRLAERVTTGLIMLGRAYVKAQLPGWFDLHAQTMDSALAARIRSSPVMPT